MFDTPELRIAERNRRLAERQLNHALDHFCEADAMATSCAGIVVTSVIALVVGLVCYVVLR